MTRKSSLFLVQVDKSGRQNTRRSVPGRQGLVGAVKTQDQCLVEENWSLPRWRLLSVFSCHLDIRAVFVCFSQSLSVRLQVVDILRLRHLPSRFV